MIWNLSLVWNWEIVNSIVISFTFLEFFFPASYASYLALIKKCEMLKLTFINHTLHSSVLPHTELFTSPLHTLSMSLLHTQLFSLAATLPPVVVTVELECSRRTIVLFPSLHLSVVGRREKKLNTIPVIKNIPEWVVCNV